MEKTEISINLKGGTVPIPEEGDLLVGNDRSNSGVVMLVTDNGDMDGIPAVNLRDGTETELYQSELPDFTLVKHGTYKLSIDPVAKKK